MDFVSDFNEFTYSPDAESGSADWSMLAAHHKRGAVFLVGQSVDLKVAAKALAEDDVQVVKVWLDSGDLAKVTDEQASNWEQDKYKKFAEFYIVQPYVLIKLLEDQ